MFRQPCFTRCNVNNETSKFAQEILSVSGVPWKEALSVCMELANATTCVSLIVQDRKPGSLARAFEGLRQGPIEKDTQTVTLFREQELRWLRTLEELPPDFSLKEIEYTRLLNLYRRACVHIEFVMRSV